MQGLIKRNLKRAKLLYLWITRILLAPNRFGVALPTRLWYAVFGGFTGDQYALYGLNRTTKRQYLSEFDWYRSRWINEPFDSMLNNKIVCNEVLRHHIRVPRVYYVKNRGRLVAHDNSEPVRSSAQVIETLTEAEALFMKPVGAGKGKGVCRLDAREGAFWIDSEPATERQVAHLIETTDNWFLSQAIDQHPVLAQIYPRTTNTVRFITMRAPDGEQAEPFFAVLRIGTDDTVPVDNGSRGGLVAQIDMETGTLSEARTLWSLDVFEQHPHSGAQIKGVRLPGWQSLREQMLTVANELPYLQFVAWDVLIAADGVCVIEANTSSGVNIVQLWGPQRSGELGDFYRAHGVIG